RRPLTAQVGWNGVERDLLGGQQHAQGIERRFQRWNKRGVRTLAHGFVRARERGQVTCQALGGSSAGAGLRSRRVGEALCGRVERRDVFIAAWKVPQLGPIERWIKLLCSLLDELEFLILLSRNESAKRNSAPDFRQGTQFGCHRFGIG